MKAIELILDALVGAVAIYLTYCFCWIVFKILKNKKHD